MLKEVAFRLQAGASVVALAILVAMTLFLFPSDVSASTFDPILEASLADPTPGATSDIATEFNLNKGDANFGAVGGFIDPGIKVPKFEDLPIAAWVGDLAATATLGLLNAACSAPLQFEFNFYNASTDNSPGNVITPPPVINPTTQQPTPDRLNVLAGDQNHNGLRDGIEQYPSFLNELFKDPSTGAPIKPWARYIGYTTPPFRSDVGLTVTLQTLIFTPGTKLSAAFDFDPRLGFVSVSVLLDPSAAATKSPVTDFCSPLLAATNTYGVSKDNPSTTAVEPPTTVRQNPAGNATLNFVTFATSQRDADDDGLENSFDTCPFQTNLEDPRSPQGNPDQDGIDAVCDPAPADVCYPGATGSGSLDCDGDGWLNRGDNCPLVPNADQADDDLPPGANAPDGGGRLDGIGRACDTNPDSPDGHFHAVCKVKQVNVGAGGAALDPLALRPCDPNAPLPTAEEVQRVLEQTIGPDQSTSQTTTTTSTTTTRGGAAGGPGTGIGSLAPAAASIPAWAAVASGLGGAGLLGSLGAFASRFLRRRR